MYADTEEGGRLGAASVELQKGRGGSLLVVFRANNMLKNQFGYLLTDYLYRRLILLQASVMRSFGCVKVIRA